jgi:F5/8 type C domain-containing protein
MGALRALVTTSLIGAFVALLLLLRPLVATGAPASGATTQPIGFQPLANSQAASHVRRRAWEPRAQNRPYAHPPTSAELSYFHRWDGKSDDCGLRAHVDGDFTGTTDETIQWAAWKWGIDEDVIRAEMQSETNWDHHDGVVNAGDNGQSFGISQIKVTVHDGFDQQADQTGHPSGGGSAAHSLSLNLDYYGYVLRAAMNGCEGWLAGADTSTHAYPPTSTSDALWGAVGRWYCGCWWQSGSDAYRQGVQQHLADADWVNASWFYGTAGPWPSYGAASPTPTPTPTPTSSTDVEKATMLKTAASSTESASYPPSAAIDGNGATRFSSAHADRQWWRIDFGYPRTLDRVHLNWETPYCSAYRIQRSSDAATWTTAASATASASGRRTTSFTAQKARYWRVLCDRRATRWGMSFSTFKAYGPPSE